MRTAFAGLAWPIARSLFILTLLLAFPALAADLPVISPPDFSTLPTAEVLTVVDGDTIKIKYDGKAYTCRLIGVDTPETKHPQKPVQAYGREATTFTTNLLLGEKVWVSADTPGAYDMYQRLLVYLWRQPDGLFVNAEIVRQGYGHAYTLYPFQYMEQFRAYEKYARETPKGLWKNYVEPQPEKKKPVFEWKEPPKRTTPPKLTQPQPVSAPTVYVTRTGSKYHSAGCRYLSKSSIPMKLSEAKRRYSACSKCSPPLIVAGGGGDSASRKAPNRIKASPTQRSKPKPEKRIDKSEGMQRRRNKLINELIQKGIFYKIDVSGTIPNVWVTPSFHLLEADAKEEFISAVYTYHYSTIDILNIIRLIDSQSGKEIGYYTPEVGLKLN